MKRVYVTIAALLMCDGVGGAMQEAELTEIANRKDVQSVDKAIQAIKDRDDAVGVLIMALRDDDHFVRLAAATALSELGAKSVPEVTKLVSDSDEDVRTWAISILGAIGKPASSAAPLLEKTLDDPKAEIAELAATALAQIGSRKSTDAFVDSIGHPNKEIREQVIAYLRSADSAIAIPALIAALKDHDAEIRENAVVAILGKFDSPEAVSAVPALIEALEDPNAEVRWWAAHTLAAFKEKSKEAVPALIKALQNDLRANSPGMGGSSALRLCNQCADTLGAIGPDAVAAVPALIEALEDRDPHMRRAVAEALGKIGPGASAAVPKLCEMVGDRYQFVHGSAVKALGKIGPEAKEAIPLLMESLDEEYLGTTSAEALGLIGDAAKPAIPKIREMLKDEDADARLIAAQAIWRLEGPDDEALNVLIEIVRLHRSYASDKAAKFLGEIGPPARAAVPDLVDAIKNGGGYLPQEAEKALQKIQKTEFRGNSRWGHQTSNRGR